MTFDQLFFDPIPNSYRVLTLETPDPIREPHNILDFYNSALNSRVTHHPFFLISCLSAPQHTRHLWIRIAGFPSYTICSLFLASWFTDIATEGRIWILTISLDLLRELYNQNGSGAAEQVTPIRATRSAHRCTLQSKLAQLERLDQYIGACCKASNPN